MRFDIDQAHLSQLNMGTSDINASARHFSTEMAEIHPVGCVWIEMHPANGSNVHMYVSVH